MYNSFIIAVIGAPHSGKTHTAEIIREHFGGIHLLCDNYRNIDDIIKCTKAWKNGQSCDYAFIEDKEWVMCTNIVAPKVVILDGCWILENKQIDSLVDYVICMSRPNYELLYVQRTIREMMARGLVNYESYTDLAKKIIAQIYLNHERAHHKIINNNKLGPVNVAIIVLQQWIK